MFTPQQPDINVTALPRPEQSLLNEENQEYINGDSNGWVIQWRIKKDWSFQVPKIKECKQRKESFSTNFNSVFYKAPYKYHMELSGEGNPNIEAYVGIDLNYESGESLTNKQVISNGSKEVKEMKMETNANVGSLTIGPFQFNVCSFRQSGKKFRIVLDIFQPELMFSPQQTLICRLISPSFVIRAKKPIKNPGIRKKKRKNPDGSTSDQPAKKRKVKPHKPQTLTDHIKQQQVVSPFNPPPQYHPDFNQQPQIPHPPGIQNLNQIHFTNQDMMDFLISEQDKQKTFANRVISEYTGMEKNKRLFLLKKLLEISTPAEQEYIRSIFYGKKESKDQQGFPEFEKIVDLNENE